MPHLFDNLLVSSPNGGGLLFIHQDQVFHLDNINTTGISLSGTTLLRGLQPQGLVLYKGHCIEQYDVPHIHDIHDVLLAEPFLYTVGTTANEVLKLNERAEEVQRWTLDGENDAKHINCLALWNQRIVFCAFGDFTEHRQYKGKTERAGFVQDLHTGERLIAGLSQPHSLFAMGQHLLLANSETKELHEYDSSGTLLRSQVLEGYTRGIYVQDGKIYIGLSRSRNIESDDLSSARLIALDSQSWQELGYIDLPVSEVYSVHGIENPDALPALLAGISQHASNLHQRSINEHGIQLQAFTKSITQLQRSNTSLEEQLQQHHDTLLDSLQAQQQQLIQLTEEKSGRENLLREFIEQEQTYKQLVEKLTLGQQTNNQQLAEEKSDHESLRQKLITQDQLYKQLVERLTLGQHTKNQQLESTLALLTERDVELIAMSEQAGACQQQQQQTLDELDTALGLLAQRDSDLIAMSKRFEEIREQHEQLLSSKSWLLTQPIRNLRRWLKL